MARRKPKRQEKYEARVDVEIVQVRPPIIAWPGQLKQQFKKIGFDPNTAKGWYRWRINSGSWNDVLWLPEERTAILQLGPKASAVVENVASPGDALKQYVKALNE